MVCHAGSPTDRKISFAPFGGHSERSDSIHSSTTTLSQADMGPDSGKGGELEIYSNSLIVSIVIIMCLAAAAKAWLVVVIG